METQLNGINYTEQLVTDEELAVIKAMRLGASISIDFHWLHELSEVDERINLFADIERTGHSWIDENKRGGGEHYISFHKGMGQIKVFCYMEIKKD